MHWVAASAESTRPSKPGPSALHHILCRRECGLRFLEEKDEGKYRGAPPFPDSRLTGAHIRLYARRPLLLGDAGAFEVLDGEAVDAYYRGLWDRAACDGFPHLTLTGPAELRAGATAACAVQMTNNQGAPLALRKLHVDVGVPSLYRGARGYAHLLLHLHLSGGARGIFRPSSMARGSMSTCAWPVSRMAGEGRPSSADLCS